MRKANSKRKRKMSERNYGQRGDAVRQMECIAVPFLRSLMPYDYMAPEPKGGPQRCSPGIQACHDEARKMGGCGGDRFSLFPACGTHHAEAGARGTSDRAEFEARYHVNVTAKTLEVKLELDERGIP